MTKEFACTELQPLGGIDKGWVPQHGFGPIRLSVLLWIMPLSSPAHVFFQFRSLFFHNSHELSRWSLYSTHTSLVTRLATITEKKEGKKEKKKGKVVLAIVVCMWDRFQPLIIVGSFFFTRVRFFSRYSRIV